MTELNQSIINENKAKIGANFEESLMSISGQEIKGNFRQHIIFLVDKTTGKILEIQPNLFSITDPNLDNVRVIVNTETVNWEGRSYELELTANLSPEVLDTIKASLN